MTKDSGLNLVTLVTAPGDVLRLDSPYSPQETVRRMQNSAKLIAFGSGWIIQLPIPNKNRCLFAWIESNGSGSRLAVQMRTLPRVALARMAAGLFLLLVAFMMGYVGKVFFFLLFFVVGLSLFFTAQFERFANLNTARYVYWLEKQIGATKRL